MHNLPTVRIRRAGRHLDRYRVELFACPAAGGYGLVNWTCATHEDALRSARDNFGDLPAEVNSEGGDE